MNNINNTKGQMEIQVLTKEQMRVSELTERQKERVIRTNWDARNGNLDLYFSATLPKNGKTIKLESRIDPYDATNTILELYHTTAVRRDILDKNTPEKANEEIKRIYECPFSKDLTVSLSVPIDEMMELMDNAKQKIADMTNTEYRKKNLEDMSAEEWAKAVLEIASEFVEKYGLEIVTRLLVEGFYFFDTDLFIESVYSGKRPFLNPIVL